MFASLGNMEYPRGNHRSCQNKLETLGKIQTNKQKPAYRYQIFTEAMRIKGVKISEKGELYKSEPMLYRSLFMRHLQFLVQEKTLRSQALPAQRAIGGVRGPIRTFLGLTEAEMKTGTVRVLLRKGREGWNKVSSLLKTCAGFKA